MDQGDYSIYWAFYLYLVMLVVQWGVATFTKSKQANATPGKIDEGLSHGSFIFRAHRTFHNSLENSIFFIGPLILAYTLGYASLIFTIAVWVYVLARVVHMVLYYAIATEENPSPRSYFFLIGIAANLLMLAMVGIALVAG